MRAAVLSLALVAGLARGADDDAEWSASGRAGAVTNYVTRGITQTWGRPAAQAEIEIEHRSGLYGGAFLSNVSRRQFPGGRIEIESWAGYEHEIGRDASLALEGVYYAYPGANYSKGSACASGCPSQSFNTFQGRVVGRWHWLTTRFAYTFGDYFGDSSKSGFTSSTRGTWYWDLNAEYPLPQDSSWKLVGHAGYTRYTARLDTGVGRSTSNPNYADWRLGVAKEFGRDSGWRIGAYYTQAGNDAQFKDTRSLTGDSVRNIGGAAFILGADWRF